MNKWYTSFAAVPGVVYEPLRAVDCGRIPGVGVSPALSEGFEDLEGLMWPATDDWLTSASPSLQIELPKGPPEEILMKMSEALETPGSATDYHFVLQRAGTLLWGCRKGSPGIYETIEVISLLNIALLEACKDTVFEGSWPPGIYAFGRLREIYKREGRHFDAQEVLERGKAVGYYDDDSSKDTG